MNPRKLKILSKIVDEYIVTGEPVGSKAIMEKLDIKISAATIRNEMSWLEQMGYLEQPHTSAGRIPTYEAYRVYIDEMTLVNPLSDEEKQYIDTLIPQGDLSDKEIVETASLALSELTKCATVVASSAPKFSVITKVEVIPTGKRLYVLLLITSSGAIKNKVCRLEFDLSHEQLDFFSNFIRENLEGVPLDEISDEMLEKLQTAMGSYMVTLSPLLSGFQEISSAFNDDQIIISGERNLLVNKDFNQNEIISFLDNKDGLKAFFDETFSGLHVMFSEESDSFVINNSSFIVSPFNKKGTPVGALGLIGPMRLDYAKFIPYIEYFTNKISEILSNDDDED